MSSFEFERAVVLGVIQGVTEFLPISSDGHLAIVRHFFGGTSEALAETLLLHLGTLFATILVMRAEVRSALASTVATIRARALTDDTAREVRNVLLASIPTALIGLSMEPYVDAWSADLTIVAICLVVSALFVGSTHFTRNGALEALPWQSALLVGVVQGLAVLPGWSRSGSTIAAAMALGLAPIAAFRFSFLLSLPAVAGACLLELRDPAVWARFETATYVGAGVAFVTGVASLRLVRSTLGTGRFAWFAVYLVWCAIAVALLPTASVSR